MQWIKLKDEEPMDNQIVIFAKGDFRPLPPHFFGGCPYSLGFIKYDNKTKEYFADKKEFTKWMDPQFLLTNLDVEEKD